MTAETIFFFDGKLLAMELYERFERRVTAEIPDVNIMVQKTQITFSNHRVFACVSMLPVQKKERRPEEYIVVTFGTGERIFSPRIDASTEPYPNRWTHHVMITGPEEIDGELMNWVKIAADFSASKR